MRLWLPGVIASTQPQVLIQQVRLNDFAWVHLPVWIPQRFELAESLDQLGAKHFRQQLGPRLAVTMLSGERTTVTDNQVCGLFHKLAVVGDAFSGLQIEVDAHVHACMAEVAVESTAITVPAHQLTQVAQVVPQLVRGDGSVFPTLPAKRLARDVRSGAQSRLADFPNPLSLLIISE